MGKGDILLFTLLRRNEQSTHTQDASQRRSCCWWNHWSYLCILWHNSSTKKPQLPSYRLSIMCSFSPRQDLKCRLRLPQLLIFSGFLNSGFVCQRVNRMLAAALRFVMVDCSITHTRNERHASSSRHTYSWGYPHVESNPPYEAPKSTFSVILKTKHIGLTKNSGGHETKESQIQIRGAHQKLPHCLVCACLC